MTFDEAVVKSNFIMECQRVIEQSPQAVYVPDLCLGSVGQPKIWGSKDFLSRRLPKVSYCTSFRYAGTSGSIEKGK